MIRAALSERRLAVFRHADKQALFLRRIEGALTYLRTRADSPADPHRAQDRVAAVGRAIDQLQAALRSLGQPERAVIEHGRQGQIERAMVDLEGLQAQTGAAQNALAMPRGPHDAPPGGGVRLLVAQIADAWLQVFGRKPSPKPDGAFFAVVNIVLGQAGLPEIGKDALRTLLKGAGLRA
jgi:hypothetical protein